MVDHPVWLPLEQRRPGVDVDGSLVDDRLVALLRVLAGGVEEVAGADGLPHPRRRLVARRRRVGRGDQVEAVAVHDRHQLLPDVLRAPHRPLLDKVLEAPRLGEVGGLPALVDRQQSQVVPLGRVEARLFRVGGGLLLARAVKDVLRREHRDDRQHLLGASQVDRGDERFRQGWVERELGHFPAEARQQPLVVERAEVVELLERRNERRRRRRVHEIKAEQVVDSHGLQGQDGHAQVRPLDFRDGKG